MLYFLPLEPFEQRYTGDWYVKFRQEFDAASIKHLYVDGKTLTDKIETGRFLDVYNTVYWKSTQLALLAQVFRSGQVNDGDSILTADLWHPGFEAVNYMAKLTGKDVHQFGILHAGTYDHADFTYQAGLEPTAKYLEQAWVEQCEKVFVATNFHKMLLCDARAVCADRVVVTGLPFYGEELRAKYAGIEKEPGLVVFPNRLDPEKQPDYFDIMATLLERNKKLRFVKTVGNVKSKDEYYRLLAKASVVVSFSLQETFGYAMLEAAALGCSLVVPDRLSYIDMYPKWCRYGSFAESLDMVVEFANNPKPIGNLYWQLYAYSIERMAKEMELSQ